MKSFEETVISRLQLVEREVERLRVKESPDMSSYLGITAKAADSAKLGGVNASDLLSGWIPASGWTINDAANGAVNVPSGALSIYSVGDKVKLTNQTVKYFYIVRVEDNYMFLNGGSNYVLSGAYGTVLTNVYYSHASNPVGFPQWFDYTPILTVSGGTAPTYATFINRYCQVGKLVVVTGQWYNASGGTAGAGAAEILVTLPVPPKNLDAVITGSAGYGNGGAYATGGIYIFASSSKFAITKLDAGFLTGAAQNNAMRSVYFTFEYEAA